MKNHFFLGLDLGSISLNAVIIDETGKVLFKKYVRTSGFPIDATISLLKEISNKLGDISFLGTVVTGSGKGLIAKSLNAVTVNEIVAQATAGWSVFPDVQTIFEIGGQDSKHISIGKKADGTHYLLDHSFNELCAAGTGAFLDQQAKRLNLSIEEFSSMAALAENIPSVAGRCTVFAKSDMIHLQQKAVPTDEIAAGLCFALARNYLAALCKGKLPKPPVIFQGGVAANAGVVRAFREILNLNEKEFIIHPEFDVTGALGSALIAKENLGSKPVPLSEMILSLKNNFYLDENEECHPPLSNFAIEKAKTYKSKLHEAKFPLFLGIDVGSVSTKGAIIDSDKNLIFSSYVATAGKPVEALKLLINEIIKLSKEEITVANIVSTGSGRHLASILTGSSAIDEISAQSISCSHYFPDSDTIFEIGGQDSKFIKLKNGVIETFKMNRACAAGTGSFLEEQAGRLKVEIKEQFASLAMNSTSPVKLGSRCTVFMDSDLVHHLQRGRAVEDLCAGLCYSIGENYLEKVVGSSSIGEKIVFQGGVAKNGAVKAVFEELLNKKISLHPFPEISGAIGAAITALSDYESGISKNCALINSLEIKAKTEIFECALCDNLCEIRKITTQNGKTSFFGSICGRFEKMSEIPIKSDDLFDLREKFMESSVIKSKKSATLGEIALPDTLTMRDHLPFWVTFLSQIGFNPLLSEKTKRAIVEMGLVHVPAEFCFPIKVLFGHVQSLTEEGFKQIFIPHLRLFTAPGETTLRYACPYTQAAPYIVRENLSADVKIISLEYPVDGEFSYWIKETAKQFNLSKKVVREALKKAFSAQNRFNVLCVEEGEKVIERLRSENKRGAVIIGRPYNTTDRHINLNLARKLKELDIEPIPFDFLPLDKEKLPPIWDRVRWGYGRKLIMAARILKREKMIGAVIVTNFGCGPDAFIDQYLEHELKESPHLLIEFDDHQAEAGLLTRLEAFARNFKILETLPKEVKSIDPGKSRMPLRKYTYYIPSFMDHAYALTGALKASGCKTVLLPPTDDRSWELGSKYAYGRECHPFISFLGDILKEAEKPGFDPAKACYFGPSYFGACLLPQYIIATHLVLERLGFGEMLVMNVTDETNMAELGPAYMVRLALGVYVIDRFFKWKTEIEPYEKIEGEVNRVYKEIILSLEEGLANGGFFKALKKGVKELKKVELLENDGKKQKIGVVGDVYTRINEHSNNQLFERLKNMGFEPWAACSLIDVSFLGMEQLHEELYRKGKKALSLFAKTLIPAIKTVRWLVDRHFPKTIRTPQERDIHAVKKVANKYANLNIDKVLALNLNRIEEFYQSGADGILNVMCHNCMLGTVTASLSKSIRRDMNEIPICTLVYEGLKSTHNENRLEAFAHQVKNIKKS
ncbi:MAG: acyl-CoA dehydratase activase [bacterium]